MSGPRSTSSRVGPRRGWIPELTRIKNLIATKQVDFVGIGDSNQLFGGLGWDHGFQFALSQQFPMWATGLISQNENSGNGSGQGYLYNRIGGTATFATTGAPPELSKFLVGGVIFPANYSYIADGGSMGSQAPNGLALLANCPIDNGAALAFDYHYGTFDSGSGTFNPRVRLEQSPFNLLGSTSDIVSTNAGSFGMSRYTYTIPADATRGDKAIGAKWNRVGTTGITGPFFGTYLRARNPLRTAGFSYGTLVFNGGQPLRTMATNLQTASDETLTHYLGTLRTDQVTTEKTIVFCVNSGLNDRNASATTSVGPNPTTPGDSNDAFYDNLEAIRIRIEDIWDLNEWDKTEINWIIFPSHPLTDPDDAKLINYRATAVEWALANKRAVALNIPSTSPRADFVTNDWYANSVSDFNHLKVAGYEQVARRMLRI
jgi:hypothetical protein